MFRITTWKLVGVFVLCGCFSQSFAAATDCDRRSVAQSNNDQKQGYRYIEADDRCEGFYVQPISSIAGLEVVAYQLGELLDDSSQLERQIDLTLVGSPARDGLYQLKAHSLDPDVYYQLDKMVGSDALFKWNAFALQEFHQQRNALPVGFMACQGRCREKLPLYVAVRMRGAQGNGLKLVFQARSGLAQVHYKLSNRKTGNQSLQKTLEADRFPPRRPIIIDLDPAIQSQPGEYDLTVYSVATNGQLDELKAKLLIPPLASGAQ